MQDTPENSTDAPLSRRPFRKPRQSIWPVIVGVAIVVVIGVGVVLSLFRESKLDTPWDIDYPNITVLGGEDEHHEGQHRLRIAVRFEKDVVSAQDALAYLSALVKATDRVYVYYHIKVLNKQDVHVLDAVAHHSGRHSLTPTAAYYEQGGGDVDETGLTDFVLDGPTDEATPKQPWEFNYAGVTWLSGKVDTTEEGRRHLKVRIRFDRYVVTTRDVEEFLEAFLARQKKAYPYYHVKVFNRERVHVLDAVADEEGKRRVVPTEHFPNQEDPGAPAVEIIVD